MKKTLLFLPAAFLFACSDQPKETSNVQPEPIKPTFEMLPPVEEFKPQAAVFSVDNTKDTVLISDHGSFVHVPANCFTDEQGNLVDQVEVEFTEYNNPADILFSGIPMEYVTENGNETFQSAGMCEINATSKGEKLTISKGKFIDIGLKNQAQDPDYNLYYFDKQKGEWIEKEKKLPVETDCIPVKPVTLTTIDTSRILHVDVREYSFNRDFLMWDDSRFFLLPGQEPKYHGAGAAWYHMEVIETTNPELFIIKFNGELGGEQVVEALKVQPLIDSAHYNESLQVFKRKMREHALKLLDSKIKRKKLDADETIAKVKADHEVMKAELKKKEERIKIEMEQQRIADSIRQAELYAAAQVRTDVMRTFSVNQLGIYNCDRFYKREILATKRIAFQNDGEDLAFTNSYLCSPRDNAVLNYLSFKDNEYHLDLSSGTFYFVGIKGKEIYCKEITLETRNGTQEIEQIEKEVFEHLMI